MKTRIEKALEEATVSTFEYICFMYPAPELKDIQKNLKLEAAAEVKYKGNYTGKLLIETRGDLLSAIAGNILSNDFPNPQQKNDALGELANIICGNIVPYLGRGGQGYKIESPHSLNKKELSEKKKQGKPLAKVTLNFNQGRADIKFYVDGDFATEEKKK
jgi:CheY-specific phosphatase CheX